MAQPILTDQKPTGRPTTKTKKNQRKYEIV